MGRVCRWVASAVELTAHPVVLYLLSVWAARQLALHLAGFCALGVNTVSVHWGSLSFHLLGSGRYMQAAGLQPQ